MNLMAADGGFFSDMSWRYNGYLRAELSARTSGSENPNNQGGNVFNDRTVDRTAFLPPALGGGTWGAVPLGINGSQVFGSQLLPNVGFSDQVRRGDFVSSEDNWTNLAVFRAESEVQIKLSKKLTLIGRVRGVYDPGIYEEFDAANVRQYQGGIVGGEPDLYHGSPNYFDYIVEGGSKPNPLEWTGENYQIYFPALVLDYNSGKLNIRAGNQQIAWGQAIFFRVFDVPSGLDYRRHLIVDRGLEEFSDKRQPALGVRVTYQVSNNILVDGYATKFQPTVYPNPNTPFNVIPVQFTVHDRYVSGGWDDKINVGLRLKGDYGQWGWQAMAVHRFNPDGTFRWTESGVRTPLYGDLGQFVTAAYNAKVPNCPEALYDPATCRRFADAEEAFANTPFEASPGGVYSANEWFEYAGQARLNGVLGLNAGIDEFQGSIDLFASSVDNYDQAIAQLNTFFMAGGGSLRGHIAREYHSESVFGLGGSYVIDSENHFLNQLIVNLEVQYTPERTFTNGTYALSRNYIEQDEYTVALVTDKWHRWTDEFPATYMVFQALTKNRSDLVGRHLGGMGGNEQRESTGLGSNANYVVFGFLQPWPNKIFALEFAALLDVEGGVLMQPLLQWNPGKGMTVEAFYNFVDGSLWGERNNNLLSTADFVDELSVRVTYGF
tara:strand:+ start:4527 stop:6512 length:1986 start_codon:yes stop_codon:yes gene_type:complete